MPELPWWAWTGIVVIILFVLLRVHAAKRRAVIRKELIDYLAKHHPEISVQREEEEVLHLRISGTQYCSARKTL